VGVAETYDILVRVPEKGAWELRATAHDGSGYASVWIGEGTRHPAPDLPRPNLYHLMMDPTFARVFALTPSGSMGMPDGYVREGRFDSPGMNMGMESMGEMGSMGDTGSMPDTMDMVSSEQMPGTATEDMDDMGEMSQEIPMAGMETMTGTGQGMAMDEPMSTPVPISDGLTPEGRMFGKSFRYLAADVSSSKSVAVDGMDPRRPGTPYQDLKSVRTTALDSDSPVREIRLTLDGDMERYVWFLNNKALSETDSILIRRGETVRFIMINRTMMHHPMHLHGHFFRVMNGQGDRSPLKHTVDVAPMTTTVIEFAANEVGDWFFHCHLLYHMKSGMARLVHYEGFDPGGGVNAVRSQLYKDSWYFWGQADLLGNMTEGALTASNTRHILMVEWEAGWENVPHMEREGAFTWDYYLNRLVSFFAGANHDQEADEDETRGILGLRYLLPLNIESFAWIDDEGDNRYGIEKEFMFTPRVALFGEWEYDTQGGHEDNVGLSFLVSRGLSVLVQRHSQYEWGAGIQVRF
jgi:FtsP/CotA-like multicopper oxidase with cupredoxin domain